MPVSPTGRPLLSEWTPTKLAAAGSRRWHRPDRVISGSCLPCNAADIRTGVVNPLLAASAPSRTVFGKREGSARWIQGRSADSAHQPRGPAHSVRRPGDRAPGACREGGYTGGGALACLRDLFELTPLRHEELCAQGRDDGRRIRRSSLSRMAHPSRTPHTSAGSPSLQVGPENSPGR
jgi:hypothetical protein